MLPREGAALAQRVLQGDRRAVARAITLVESRDPEARALMAALYPRTGRAHVIGITGPPGSGKSTLVDRLIEYHRKADRSVGVIAVDPSSPFTGGALLGDRVRMEKRATDPAVFIRSMATRGHLGGLSRAAADAARILDASGKDIILVETVGVGQAEVEVMSLAETVLVVAVPGLGDEIQNIKAGLMEVGDIFVVNKGDREGADRTIAELEAWLEHAASGWSPLVVRTVAATGEGIPELAAQTERHRAWLAQHAGLEGKRRRQAEAEILTAAREHAEAAARASPDFAAAVEAVAKRATDPYSALEGLR